jgi:cell division control protein 6
MCDNDLDLDDIVLNVRMCERSPPLAPTALAAAIAAQRCSPQYAQAQLFGRQAQSKQLHRFWEACASDDCGGVLYVSGRPGCGKTATVRAAAAAFKAKRAQADVAFVNCVTDLCGASRPLSVLLDALHVKRDGSSGDEELLRKFARSKRIKLVVLDELDQLDVRLLSDLIALARSPGSRLVLVGIANSLDLVEKLGAAGSDLQTLAFDAYDERSIVGIVSTRLGPMRHTHMLMSDAALELCARNAAKVGDVRPALQFCCKALEELRDRLERDNSVAVAAASTGRYAIDIAEMNKVIASLVGQRNPTVSLVASLSLADKLVLCAVFRGNGEQRFEQMLEQYQQLCKRHSFNVLAWQRVMQALEKLGDDGLVVLRKHSRSMMQSTVALKVNADDVRMALENDRATKPIV